MSARAAAFECANNDLVIAVEKLSRIQEQRDGFEAALDSTIRLPVGNAKWDYGHVSLVHLGVPKDAVLRAHDEALEKAKNDVRDALVKVCWTALVDAEVPAC